MAFSFLSFVNIPKYGGENVSWIFTCWTDCIHPKKEAESDQPKPGMEVPRASMKFALGFVCGRSSAEYPNRYVASSTLMQFSKVERRGSPFPSPLAPFEHICTYSFVHQAKLILCSSCDYCLLIWRRDSPKHSSVSLPAKGPLSSHNLGLGLVWMKANGRCEKAKWNFDSFPSKKAEERTSNLQPQHSTACKWCVSRNFQQWRLTHSINKLMYLIT